MTEYHFNLANPHANLLRDTPGDSTDSIDLVYGLSLLDERGEKHACYRAAATQTLNLREHEVQIYNDCLDKGFMGFVRKLFRRPTGLVGLIRIDYQTGEVKAVRGNIKGTVNVQVLFNRYNANRRPV